MVVSMAYGDLIRKLFERSKMSVVDYAVIAQVTPQHLSMIKEGHEPGSEKILKNCLKHAGIEFEACLDLPDDRQDRGNHLLIAERLLKRKDRFGQALREYLEDTDTRLRVLASPTTHAPPRKRLRGAS